MKVDFPLIINNTAKLNHILSLVNEQPRKKAKDRVLGFVARTFLPSLVGGIAGFASRGNGGAGGTHVVNIDDSQTAVGTDDCEASCKCKNTNICYRPHCPAIPPLGKCAASPRCHPICRLDVAQGLVIASNSTTTTTTTTTAPSTSRKPKKKRPSKKNRNENRQKKEKGKSGRKDRKNKKKKKKKCKRRRRDKRKRRGWNRMYSEKVPDQSHKLLGTVYLESHIKELPLNETAKKEIINFIHTDSKANVTREMQQDVNDVLRYFGDKHIDFSMINATMSRNNTVLRKGGGGGGGASIWDGLFSGTVAALVNGIFGVVGHLIQNNNQREVLIKCKCPEVECPPVDLWNCEGDCPNNPGCNTFSCNCKYIVPRNPTLGSIQ